MGGGSSGGGSTSTTYQNTDPWSGVKPYLSQAFGYSPYLFENAPLYYAGDTVADPSKATTNAWSMIEKLAKQGTPGIDTASKWVQGLLSGNPKDPALQQLYATSKGNYFENPYIDRAYNQAYDAGRSSLDAQFAGSGRYGSGLHQSEANRRANELATSIYYPAYQQERQNQLNASQFLGGLGMQGAQLSPALLQAKYLPSEMLANVGAARDAYEQAQINADIQRWDYYNNLPQNQYTSYLQNLSYASPYSASSEQSNKQLQQPYNPYSTAAGLGLIGSSLFGGGTYSTDPRVNFNGLDYGLY